MRFVIRLCLAIACAIWFPFASPAAEINWTGAKPFQELLSASDDNLRLAGFIALDAEKDIVIEKSAIESREVQKLSIMPEGQEQLMSRTELRDLLMYLLSLK